MTNKMPLMCSIECAGAMMHMIQVGPGLVIHAIAAALGLIPLAYCLASWMLPSEEQRFEVADTHKGHNFGAVLDVSTR